jgi:branched-subunit amino acid ABC-type transport system permease component
MKKAILITFVIAIVVVTLAGWLVQTYTDIRMGWAVRIPLILGITFIAAIFSGAGSLVSKASRDKPD